MKKLFMDWNTKWKILFLLLINVHCIKSDIFHHYKLKKFLTAVAFARALGRRPTILPVPIPIPIPIAQNEVIKIPAGGAGKTMVIGGGAGSNKDTAGIAHIISGGSSLSNLGSGFTGSSSYGYQLPGVSNPNVINLSSLGGMATSESNVINLSALGGNRNPTGSKILILGSKGGNLLGSADGSSSIINLGNMGSGLSSGLSFGTNGISPDLAGLNLGLNGINFGGDFQGSNTAFSMQSPQIFQIPQNFYSDKPRRRFPPKFRGRRMRGSSEEPNPRPKSFANNENSYYKEPYRYFEEGNPVSNNMQKPTPEKYKKPIPVGEKFGYRP